jgi:hypothetical protein
MHRNETRWPERVNASNAAALADAIFRAGASGDRAAGAPILRLAATTTDDAVSRQACWALGKLRIPEAVPYVVRMSQSADRDVRRGAYWALGQIGGLEASNRLVEAQKSERDAALRQVIGGALKTIRGETVRAPASKVLKRAQVPVGNDDYSRGLLEDLESADLDFATKVRLRELLQRHDPALFEEYMKAVKAGPGVARALSSSDVYRDDF